MCSSKVCFPEKHVPRGNIPLGHLVTDQVDLEYGSSQKSKLGAQTFKLCLLTSLSLAGKTFSSLDHTVTCRIKWPSITSSRQVDFTSPIKSCQSKIVMLNKWIYLESVIIWSSGGNLSSYFIDLISNRALLTPTSDLSSLLMAQSGGWEAGRRITDNKKPCKPCVA